MRTNFSFNDIIPTALPTAFFIMTFVLCLNMSFINSQLLGLSDIINSIITFTSIIVGVLVALFGIIVTISDSDIMHEIRSQRGEKALFRYCIETLISNFILLLLSIIFQSLINYKNYADVKGSIDLYSYFWYSMVIFVLVSSCRTIYYLLMISFNQTNNSIRPNRTSLTTQASNDLRNRYSDSESE